MTPDNEMTLEAIEAALKTAGFMVMGPKSWRHPTTCASIAYEYSHAAKTKRPWVLYTNDDRRRRFGSLTKVIEAHSKED
jgi:hypothetical protein